MTPQLIRKVLVLLVGRRFSNRLVDFIVRSVVSKCTTVVHGTSVVVLSDPNPQIRSRNETFSTKEPATLSWIESFEQDSLFWDVGANVGLYSVYAAIHGVRVVAFEPSAFNLEFLVRNINLNNVSSRVDVLPIATGGTGVSVNELHLSSTAWGDSQNSFGTKRGQYGTEIEVAIEYRVLGVSLDALVDTLGFRVPDFLKIDVDGIEREIVESGPSVLKQVRGVLIELPAIDNDAEHVRECLTQAGLRLELIEGRNSIWSRHV